MSIKTIAIETRWQILGKSSLILVNKDKDLIDILKFGLNDDTAVAAVKKIKNHKLLEENFYKLYHFSGKKRYDAILEKLEHFKYIIDNFNPKSTYSRECVLALLHKFYNSHFMVDLVKTKNIKLNDYKVREFLCGTENEEVLIDIFLNAQNPSIKNYIVGLIKTMDNFEQILKVEENLSVFKLIIDKINNIDLSKKIAENSCNDLFYKFLINNYLSVEDIEEIIKNSQCIAARGYALSTIHDFKKFKEYFYQEKEIRAKILSIINNTCFKKNQQYLYELLLSSNKKELVLAIYEMIDDDIYQEKKEGFYNIFNAINSIKELAQIEIESKEEADKAFRMLAETLIKIRRNYDYFKFCPYEHLKFLETLNKFNFEKTKTNEFLANEGYKDFNESEYYLDIIDISNRATYEIESRNKE